MLLIVGHIKNGWENNIFHDPIRDNVAPQD
jgi:hypothetical protein